MEEKKYLWKYGNGNGVPADVVGKEFEAIEKDNGSITKEAVVERARPEDSPLHKMFEWDDSVAGEMYRLEQARHYITAIEIKVVPVGSNNGTPIRTNGFLNVTPISKDATQSAGRYINVDTVINNPDSYQIVLNRAKRELTQFRNKYQRFEELRPVIKAIDKLMEQTA